MPNFRLAKVEPMPSILSLSFAAAATPRSSAAHAAVARVQGLLPMPAAAAAAPAPDMLTAAAALAPAAQEVIIPGSGDVAVNVSPGIYNVQVILPTGRILQEYCEIEEGQTIPLSFSDERAEDRFSVQGPAGLGTPLDILDQMVNLRPPVLEAAGLGVVAVAAGLLRKSGVAPKAKRRTGPTRAAGGPVKRAAKKPPPPKKRTARHAVAKDSHDAPSRSPRARSVSKAASAAGLTVGNSEYLTPAMVGPDQVWEHLAQGARHIPHAGSWNSFEPEASREGACLWHLPGDVVPEGKRRWGIVEAPTCREIFSLPLPWRSAMTGMPAALDVAVDAKAQGRAMTSIGVRDPFLQGLLAYLDRGQLASARTIVEALDASGVITQVILEKGNNPIAACTAAYVGLAIFDPGEQERWDGWLPNIMNRFPWLPDGGIVHARRIMLRPSHAKENKEALAALKAAYRAGIPYYGVGLQLMREMLSLFPDDAEARTMLENVSRVASRVDLAQAFTVLRYPQS